MRAGGRGEKIFLKDLFSYLHPFRTNQVTARWKKQAADYVFFHEQGWGFFPSFFLVLSLQRLLSAQFWCVCVCCVLGTFLPTDPPPPDNSKGGARNIGDGSIRPLPDSHVRLRVEEKNQPDIKNANGPEGGGRQQGDWPSEKWALCLCLFRQSSQFLYQLLRDRRWLAWLLFWLTVIN